MAGSSNRAVDIFCWRTLSTSRELVRRAHSLLDPLELHRAERFECRSLRERFVLGRLLVKLAASRRLSCAPQAVTVEVSHSGKPSIRAPAPLGVSLSYSDEWVTCALSERAVGVDIERVARCEAYVGKASAFFSEPLAQLLAGVALPSRALTFAALWCCVEAQAKLKDTSVLTERMCFALTRLPEAAGSVADPHAPSRGNSYQNAQDVSLQAYLLQQDTVLAWASFEAEPRVRVWSVAQAGSSTELMLQPLVPTSMLLSVLRSGASRAVARADQGDQSSRLPL